MPQCPHCPVWRSNEKELQKHIDAEHNAKLSSFAAPDEDRGGSA